MFERVVVVVGVNSRKQPLFSAAERVELFRAALEEAGVADVEVLSWEGLTVEICRRVGATHWFVMTAPKAELERRVRARDRADKVSTLIGIGQWFEKFDRLDDPQEFPGWHAVLAGHEPAGDDSEDLWVADGW